MFIWLIHISLFEGSVQCSKDCKDAAKHLEAVTRLRYLKALSVSQSQFYCESHSTVNARS